MKILLNATTLKKGGSLQACLNFILEAVADSATSWNFAISPEVEMQLQAAGHDCANDNRFRVMKKSPARNLRSRRELRAYERQIKPEAIFTFFGPAYVRFSAKHCMGFADPWVTHPNKYADGAHPTVTERVKTDFTVWYKRHWLRYADIWVVEADVAKQGIIKLLDVDEGKISVVPNSCRDEFRGLSTLANAISADVEVRILFISAYYIHKNFEIIPDVASHLKELKPRLNFKFVLTLPADISQTKAILEKAKSLGVANHIENSGPVAVIDAVKLYEFSHMAFIPTLLETFSATYSEAMAAGLPIVTTDFEFARDVCRDAALYFSPDKPADAAARIATVIENADVRNAMISRGKELVRQLPDGEGKYNAYTKFITENV